MNDTYTVYLHITPSNKVYVGITSQPVEKRWRKGIGYSKNKHFYRAIQKYGWDNIQHIICVSGLNRESAKNLEIELIQKYNSTDILCGYNITKGGDFRVISEETRKKISEANKGRPKSEQMRKALSEARKKMTYPNLTEEHKRKISASLLGNRRAAGCTKNRKAVIQKSLNGEIIQVFCSAAAVAAALGYDHSSICKCCNENKNGVKGKYGGRYKGFIWEYASEGENCDGSQQ